MKKFKMIDQEFICEVCGNLTKPLGYTARDHCPNCLSSKHVDNNPGDRDNDCKGILKPIGLEKNKKGLYQIVYKCEKCGMIKKNIKANDDNNNLIIELSVVKD